MQLKSASWSKSLARLGSASVAATLLASPLIGQPQSRPAIDVAALIDGAAAGDPEPLINALSQVHGVAERALLRARLAALQLDTQGTERALGVYSNSGDLNLRRQSIALSTRGDIAFAAGNYAEAAAAIEAWQRLSEQSRRAGEADDMAQALGIARLLAKEPRQVLVGGTPGTTATMLDKAGLVRAAVTINGARQDTVLDTGANLSVVSASAAKRLGVRVIEGAASVGSSTSRQVLTHVGIADRLSIAGVELEHVVFLVMDDAQLSFPLAGGYQIDTIVGFPVFRALGRVRFERAGRLSVGTAAGPALKAHNLRASGSDLYVLVGLNDVTAALHLDTGATDSGLTSRFAKLHTPLLTGMETGSEKVTGAGGNALTRRTAVWKRVRVGVGTSSLTLPRLSVAMTPVTGVKNDKLGTIGQDVLGAFDSYTVDFDSMGFALSTDR